MGFVYTPRKQLSLSVGSNDINLDVNNTNYTY